MTFIAALIPYVGASLVYVPLGIYKLIIGLSINSGIDIMRGVGILLWGFLIVSTIDNIIKPKLIGAKANIHPLVIFTGIIGGIQLFGFFGVIIGPLLLTLTIDYLKFVWDKR